MSLGHLSIQDCNDEMEMMIRSTKGAVGWSQRYFKLEEETDKLVVDLLYNKSLDCLLLYYDDGEYVTLFKDYIPSEDSGYLTKRDKSNWKKGAYTIILFKAVPLEDMNIDGRLIAENTLPYSAIDKLFIHNMINDLEDNYIIDGKIIKNGTISYNKIDKNYITRMIEDLENNYVLDGKIIRHGTISLDQVSNEFLTTINTKIKNASLTEAGVVQLSSSINSNSEDLAATPKAVKQTYDLAMKGTFFGVATNTSTIQFMANIPGLTYYDGLEFRIVFKTAPTTDAKLNINDLGNYNLKIGPDNVSDGDLEVNIPYTFLKYGNNFFCKASSRGKDTDVPDIADPDHAYLYASIVGPNNLNFAKVKNSDEIFTIYNNNLYSLNCKKKKLIPINEKGQFGNNSPLFHTLTKFKNMYIYGNRLFNNKFHLIKDFYCTINQPITVKTASGDDKETSIPLHGYLVPDYNNEKLYVVKTKLASKSENIKCFYYEGTEHNTKDGTYTPGYEDFCVLLDLEIYEIDESYNEHLLKVIRTDELLFPLCTGDSHIYSYVHYISYPDIIISGGQYGVSNGDSIQPAQVYISDIPDIKFVEDDSKIVEDSRCQKLEFKSGRNCFSGVARYKFINNNLIPMKLIAKGKYDQEQSDGMGNPYAETYSDYQERFDIDNKLNKYLFFQYRYERSGYHKSQGYSNNEMVLSESLYDADLDKFVWLGCADGSGSKKHPASDHCNLNEVIEDLYITKITNNANKYLGNIYIHGNENGQYIYNKNNLAKYNAITSKFGVQIKNNMIIYKDGINLFWYDMQFSEWNSRRDRYDLVNYDRTNALFILMMKSIDRTNTTIYHDNYNGDNKVIVRRKLNNYLFKHEFELDNYHPQTDEDIYNHKDLKSDTLYSRYELSIDNSRILSFEFSDNITGLPSTDVYKYSLHTSVIGIDKF